MKRIGIMVCLVLSLWGCKQAPKGALQVGTIAGPETELLRVAAQDAKQRFGLVIRPVVFSDYSLPNRALADKSIDANMFQHQPYLAAAVNAHDYPLVALGKTFIYPMGVYSQRYKRLSEVAVGAVVAIPNDPSNGARALLLLNKAGLLSLRVGAGANASPLDIVSNPKRLQIKELDAAQLPRILPDVGVAVINTNYAVPAGLLPSRDALFRESVDSLYANILVARRDNRHDPRLAQLLQALHSPAVRHAAKLLFNDQAIPAW